GVRPKCGPPVEAEDGRAAVRCERRQRCLTARRLREARSGSVEKRRVCDDVGVEGAWGELPIRCGGGAGEQDGGAVGGPELTGGRRRQPVWVDSQEPYVAALGGQPLPHELAVRVVTDPRDDRGGDPEPGETRCDVACEATREASIGPDLPQRRL